MTLRLSDVRVLPISIPLINKIYFQEPGANASEIFAVLKYIRQNIPNQTKTKIQPKSNPKPNQTKIKTKPKSKPNKNQNQTKIKSNQTKPKLKSNPNLFNF